MYRKIMHFEKKIDAVCLSMLKKIKQMCQFACDISWAAIYLTLGTRQIDYIPTCVFEVVQQLFIEYLSK